MLPLGVAFMGYGIGGQKFLEKFFPLLAEKNRPDKSHLISTSLGNPIKIVFRAMNKDLPFEVTCPKCATEWELTDEEGNRQQFTCDICKTTFNIYSDNVR